MAIPTLKAYCVKSATSGRRRASAEAKWFAEECYGRAEGLASVLSEYTWDDRQVSCSDLRDALEGLDDLLYLGYGMLKWWADEDALIGHDWQPPKTKEGQP